MLVIVVTTPFLFFFFFYYIDTKGTNHSPNSLSSKINNLLSINVLDLYWTSNLYNNVCLYITLYYWILFFFFFEILRMDKNMDTRICISRRVDWWLIILVRIPNKERRKLLKISAQKKIFWCLLDVSILGNNIMVA